MVTCGRVAEAETILRTSRASISLDGDDVLNMDAVGWRATMTLLGTILAARGESEEAASMLRSALGYFGDSLDDPDYETTLTTCVDAYLAQGKHRHAMSVLVESMERAEKIDPHFPLVEKCRLDIAKVAVDHEDWDTAGAFLGKVIVETDRHAQNSAEYASLLHRFAFILAKQQNLPMAESFFRNALAIYEATLGTDHPRLVSTLASFGWILKDRGEPAAAEPFVRRAHALALAAHGADHETTRETGAMLDHIRTANLWGRFNEGTAALEAKDV
jgi:tetratricopeptide (TPR) repeat protein